MELKYAFLATAAEYAPVPDGRLALIGGDLDTLWFTSFPLVYPSLAAVVKLRLSPDEVEDDHFLEAALVDSEGETLTATSPLPVPPPNASDSGRPAESGIVATLMGLTFPTPGEYRVDLAVDGRRIASLPLHAAVREEAAATYRRAWAAQFLPENDPPIEEQAAWKDILRANWERRLGGDGAE